MPSTASRILYCDWQKQQNFSQVHCDSGLSHCEQTVSTVVASGANTRLFLLAHSRACATRPQAPCAARFPAAQASDEARRRGENDQRSPSLTLQNTHATFDISPR